MHPWELALRRPRLLLGLAATLALICLPGLWRLESDNTPQVFFRSGGAQEADYRRLRALFGSDEALRLVLRGDTLRRAEGLVYLGDLERAAARLPGVRAVAGLAASAPVWPPADAAAFRARVLADPLWHDLGVVADDGRTVSVLLSLEPQTADDQTRLLRAAETLLARAPVGLSTEAVGMPVLDRALDRASHDVEWKYFPLLVVLAAGLLWLLFRNAAAVFLPLVFVLLAEILLFGPMGYAGVRLNMVLAVLAPLVLVIALATAVYVQVRFHDERAAGRDPATAVQAAYVAKLRPLIWTSVTTVVGFGALLPSHLGPVRSLGFWCLVSTVEMLGLIFLVYPALLLLAPGPPEARSRGFELTMQSLGRATAVWGIRHRKALVGVTVAFAFAGLLGLPRLRVEGNALTYLQTTHPVRAGIERLEASGVGSATVELLLIARPGAAGFASGAAIADLAFLAQELRDESGALGVVGAGDVVEAALRQRPESVAAIGGGAALREAVLERLRADPRGAEALRRFLSADGSATRLTLFARTAGLNELQPLLDRATSLARASFPDADVTATGEYPLLLDMQRGLLETLAGSLGLTLVAVAGVFSYLLRSWRYTPLAVITSLVPVVVVVGGMGWFGVPLDIATVMIASIVLGLAGDDTIHTVDRFRALSERVGTAEAVVLALEQNAPAYVVTALIRIAGFGVCALSGFVPIHRFGALSALAIALAALSDLIVVAALLGTERAAEE